MGRKHLLTRKLRNELGLFCIDKCPLKDQGGQSLCYHAQSSWTDTGTQETHYVVKVTSSAVAKQEAELMQQFEHPHILRCEHAAFDDGGLGATVTKQAYCDALQFISPKRHIRMNEEQATQLLYQVASALVAMHSAGFAHCDVKPDNIFIQEHPDSVEKIHFILADLGCTKRLDDPKSRKCATAEFTSPCKGSGETYDAFALGATVYTVLTRSYVNTRTPDFGKLAKWASPWLICLLKRLMCTNPEQRIGMNELLAELLKRDPDLHQTTSQEPLCRADSWASSSSTTSSSGGAGYPEEASIQGLDLNSNLCLKQLLEESMMKIGSGFIRAGFHTPGFNTPLGVPPNTPTALSIKAQRQPHNPAEEIRIEDFNDLPQEWEPLPRPVLVVKGASQSQNVDL